MKFISTRDFNKKKKQVDFATAVLSCMPKDGGLYVPTGSYDFRRWILYTKPDTTFANIAGTLTLALINEEYSPIICEAIATKAFSFAPVIKKLAQGFYTMELFDTPTGSHKDFGVFYLVNTVETLMQMHEKKAIFLDASEGELTSSLARAIKAKTRVKSVILFPKGKMRGIEKSDLVQYGGNVFPIEIEGTLETCHNIIRQIFCDTDFVAQNNITVANTANIGRLLPQSFFYTYAFSRLKKEVQGDIFYSIKPQNYSNVVAGLYAWKLCLPMSGFLLPATNELLQDAKGKCTLMDSIVPIKKRPPCDPADICNLERLEEVFNAQKLLLKDFIFPAKVSKQQEQDACKELFMTYGIKADSSTCSAFCSCKEKLKETKDEGSCVVLIQRDSPCLESDFIKHNTGENIETPDCVKKAFLPFCCDSIAQIAKLDAQDIQKAASFVKSLILSL